MTRPTLLSVEDIKVEQLTADDLYAVTLTLPLDEGEQRFVLTPEAAQAVGAKLTSAGKEARSEHDIAFRHLAG